MLELGCGIGLPSLALRSRGVEVLATDYYHDALLFARANAERNGLDPLPTRLVDWRDPPADLPRVPLLIAADVLYEARNAAGLTAVLPRLLAPGGIALVADPGRVYAATFRDAVRAAGWRVRELPERAEPAVGEGMTVRVRLLEVSKR